MIYTGLLSLLLAEYAANQKCSAVLLCSADSIGLYPISRCVDFLSKNTYNLVPGIPYPFLDASDTLPAYRRCRAICNGWVSVRPSVDRRSTSAAYRARAAYIDRYIYTGARAAAAGRVMLQAEARLRRDVRRCKRVETDRGTETDAHH